MNIENVIVLEEVSTDIKIAELFYEKQNKGLGGYFKDSIISDIESLWLYGGIHRKVFGAYRLLSKRFPYGVYYEINKATIIVVAVLDLRQNPKNITLFISSRIKEEKNSLK